MVTLEEIIKVPLAVTEHGTIRIKGPRMSLDSIVHHFKLGATAERAFTPRSDLGCFVGHPVGLSDAADPDLLGVGGMSKSALSLTHDRSTMPYHAMSRIARAEKIAGLIIVSRRLPVSKVIDELEILVSCSEMVDWENVI
jgi:hypothetical protein